MKSIEQIKKEMMEVVNGVIAPERVEVYDMMGSSKGYQMLPKKYYNSNVHDYNIKLVYPKSCYCDFEIEKGYKALNDYVKQNGLEDLIEVEQEESYSNAIHDKCFVLRIRILK